MGKAGAVKVEVPSASLESVTRVVSKNAKEKEQLVEDMTQMGCEGLLVEPWMLRSEVIVQEFLQARSNKWEGTIWQDPEQWTVDF